MVTISRDSPCLSITAVAKDRLPVFRTDAIKTILCAALDEARRSGSFFIFAYVIMPDHVHLITSGARKPSDALRFVKGVASRRIIQRLKEGGFHSSLEKLRGAKKADRHEYTLWERHSNVMLLTAESTFMERVHYFHQNPVRAGLVQRAEDYPWSSVRFWSRGLTDHDPLKIDEEKIIWRAPR